MPWVQRVKACQCIKPCPGRHDGAGSIWRCRRCGQHWRLQHNYMESARQYWSWRKADSPDAT